MPRSRSCGWRSETPTARRSGARAKARTRSRSAPSGSSAASAAPSPSSRSGRPSEWARRSSAARSTRSARPTRACSRRRWTRPPRAIRTCTYEPQLIDATFALLIAQTGAPLVIPALNRDGDILSDLVLPLFGSIAGSESLLVAFDDDYVPTALMAEAAHGTAPSLFGKDVANPMAMILAGAALLSHADEAGQAGGTRDPRGVPRGRRRGLPHGRPRRPRRHARVHGRGDPAHRSKLEVWASL